MGVSAFAIVRFSALGVSRSWGAYLDPNSFDGYGGSCGLQQSGGLFVPSGTGFDDSDGDPWSVFDSGVGTCMP